MSCTAYILMNGVLTPNEDLTIGSQVTLTNQDNTGVTTWDWKIVSKPTGSTATLTSAASATAYFTPDVEGAYLIRLIVNEGLVTEEQGTSVGRVKTLHKSLLPHAKDETSEGHPVEGWAKAWRESYLKVDKALGIPSDRRTVKYSGAATTGPAFLTADGTMYTMDNGDVVPSVRLATAADDKQAMFLFESGALAPGVVTVLEHGMSASIALAGVSAGDKLYATTNGAITKTSVAYLHRPIAYCVSVSSGNARVWFNPVDYTLLNTLDHEQLQGLLGGNAAGHYHLNQDQYNAANGASSPSGTNVFVTTSVLGGYVPNTRKLIPDSGISVSNGGVLNADVTITNTGVLSVTGTSGRVTATGPTGAVTLDLASLSPNPTGTYGDSSNVPRVTVDSYGRVTSVTTQPLGSYVPTTRKVDTGTGLTGGGDLSVDRTLSLATLHSGFAQTGSSTVIPVITVDVYGRVTALGSQSITYGTGTVTSVTFDTGSTGLKVNTNQVQQTINSSGTFTLSGTLNVANGGTGATTLTANGVLIGNGTGAVSAQAGAAGQILVAQGSSAPVFRSPNGDITQITSAGAFTLANTTVNPSTYGNTTNVSKITVDSKGRITDAVDVPIAFPTAPVTSVNGTAGEVNVSPSTGVVYVGLPDTGVAATQYGDGSYVPQIQVDSKGRIISASNIAINFPQSGNEYGAMRNYIINGAFDYWQRAPGASTTVSSVPDHPLNATASKLTYTADRWFLFCKDNGTQSSSAASTVVYRGTTTGTNYPNTFGIGRTQYNTSTAVRCFGQQIESELVPALKGRYLNLSFWYKVSGGVNNSSILNVKLAYDNNVGYTPATTGFTNDILNVPLSVKQKDTWTRVQLKSTAQLPFNMPSGTLKVNELALVFEFTPPGTAAAEERVDIANVMLTDAGASGEYAHIDIPFLYSSGTLANELVACQRYYEKSYDVDTEIGSDGLESSYYTTCHGSTYTSGILKLGSQVRFTTEKSLVPSVSVYTTQSGSGSNGNNGVFTVNSGTASYINANGTHNYTQLTGYSGIPPAPQYSNRSVQVSSIPVNVYAASNNGFTLRFDSTLLNPGIISDSRFVASTTDGYAYFGWTADAEYY